jgi:hypothetical protein
VQLTCLFLAGTILLCVQNQTIIVPGVPGIVTFIDKNIELLIVLGFFSFVKTIKLLVTQKN